MAAKGYCSTSDVSGFLGLTFSAGQITQCSALIEAAEVAFDGETNRAWLTGAVTDETHWWPRKMVFLRYPPVATLGTVKARPRTMTGLADEVLVADDDYEVIDLATGLIAIEEPFLYDRVKVSYTPVATVPADIRQALVEWVAAQMLPSLNPSTYGVERITLPDYGVQFSRAVTQGVMPPSVQAVAERYRFVEGF
jgi:hypothetical protein